MFNWLKEGGRKERGWKFWVKIIFGIFLIMAVVCLAVYSIMPTNQ